MELVEENIFKVLVPIAKVAASILKGMLRKYRRTQLMTIRWTLTSAACLFSGGKWYSGPNVSESVKSS